MKTYEYPNAKSVAVCGDIHGKFDELVYRMVTMYRMTDTVVIVAGDCGFGFHKRGYYDRVYERVARKLEDANCWVVFVRGNHDNPAYFDDETVCHKRWCAVSDYSSVVVNGRTILCVGGATSVDRCNREDYKPVFHLGKNEGPRIITGIDYLKEKWGLEPADWWPMETPYFDESALEHFARLGRSISAVVSHIPPSFCEDVTPPTWLSYLVENDPTLLADMQRDRETMDCLLQRLHRDCHHVRYWYYGHYHRSWHDILGGTDFTMLRELEIKELHEFIQYQTIKFRGL